MTIEAIIITVTEVISILMGLFTQLFQCWYFNIKKKILKDSHVGAVS